MTTNASSMSDSYFTSMYDDSPDPWGFDSSPYEHRKYDLTLAALTRPRYRSAFEPGCANGALTERLALRCDQLVACDIVPDVVDRARERLQGHDHVTVIEGRLGEYWPGAPLDLVVWSEVAYYLGTPQLDAAVTEVGRRLLPGGELVVVDYTGETNYPQTADSVVDAVDASPVLEHVVSHRDVGFRLDVWLRQSGTHA